jgi:hypothetical protein
MKRCLTRQRLKPRARMRRASRRISVIAHSILVSDVAQDVVIEALLRLTSHSRMTDPVQCIIVERFFEDASLDRLVVISPGNQITEDIEVILEVLGCGSTAETGGDRFQKSVLRNINPVGNDAVAVLFFRDMAVGIVTVGLPVNRAGIAVGDLLQIAISVVNVLDDEARGISKLPWPAKLIVGFRCCVSAVVDRCVLA